MNLDLRGYSNMELKKKEIYVELNPQVANIIRHKNETFVNKNNILTLKFFAAPWINKQKNHSNFFRPINNSFIEKNTGISMEIASLTSKSAPFDSPGIRNTASHTRRN